MTDSGSPLSPAFPLPDAGSGDTAPGDAPSADAASTDAASTAPSLAPSLALTLTLTLALALSSHGSNALAQSASPGATIELDPVTVKGSAGVEHRFTVTPAAVTRLDAVEVPAGEAAPTLVEALKLAPGVVIQDFFGGNDQPRIQLRGSGLQQNPAERGLLVLQDGMPVNRADGAYIVGLAAPGQAEAIEVFRGAASNRLGAAVLGGAFNFISPSGATAPGGRLAAGVGSFGRRELAARYGIDGEVVDGLIQLEHSSQDGFRDYNDSRRTSLGGNLSLGTGKANTRVFLRHTDLAFDVAGPLTWTTLRAAPRRNHGGPVVIGGVATEPGPNVLRDRPYRDASQTLAGVRTTIEEAGHLIDAGFSLARTDDSFAFPISAGLRNTVGNDANLTLRYARLAGAALPLFETGLSYAVGSADRDYFHNLGGAPGPAFGRNRLRADTLSLFAGANLPVGRFTVSPQLAWLRAGRENADRWTDPTRPTVAWNPASPTTALPAGAVPTVATDYDHHYSGLSPSLALSWEPAEGQFAWVSLARGHEPPTHDDLIGTIGGTPNSGPGRPAPGNPAQPAAVFATPDLKAQRADTIEAGWRSAAGRLAWDATVYHSRLRNELLSLRDPSGATLASVNADRTRHSGLELGLATALTPRLDGRLAWTWQAFRFDDDPVRGNNQIAGAPRHLVNLALDWRTTDSLTLGTQLRWVPSRTPVDNMNTVYSRPYALLNLAADYAISRDWAIHARLANVFDKRYAASTLVLDQASAAQAAYIPGQGRSIYVGTRLSF